MASKHHQSDGRPGSEEDDSDVIDIEAEGRSDKEDTSSQAGTQPKETPERSKSPAYVAPIPRIGSISPVEPGIRISPTDRPDLPPFVGALLIGKLVDEDGDVVDEKTGQVLAHAAGDLPSMIGRRVSNAQGDILGDDGELLGYVTDVEWPKARPPPTAPPRSLFDIMGRATSSLMVDHAGNILDAGGNVVGTFHDNNNPLHRKEKEEKEARERAQKAKEQPSAQRSPPGGDDQPQRSPPPPSTSAPQQQQQPGQEKEKEQEQEQGQEQEQSQSQSQSTTGESQPRPRRTEEERRQNAEAWRKENPNESPSDIFLDVKSTREGIQLTIRIPTVFNGQQTTPHISFS